MLQEISDINLEYKNHKEDVKRLMDTLESEGINTNQVLDAIKNFQVAIPSWALGTGGTRFGRFPFGGEPRSLEEKIEDVSILNTLTCSANAISLHIPWDYPEDVDAIKQVASLHKIHFDAVNSNTFQDQQDQKYSYKYGSLSHVSSKVRQQAIEHNIDVINIGEKLGSKSLTVWLSDGSNFPGQTNFSHALQNTQNSLEKIYAHLPDDWRMFIEYKPYEPNFYHNVIQDWGTSYILADHCGDKAFTLVDLGHHLPNTNIENIVSTLMYKGKLGGFHFNDSKYGDDDLTVGSIKPYQLFLIFNELVFGQFYAKNKCENIAWMIDASHNVKDPLEDLLQSIDAILIAYTQALCINQKALYDARESNDVVLCQEILQKAFRTDVRPIVNEMRRLGGGAIDPIMTFRKLQVRQQLVQKRGSTSRASGL